MTLRMLDSIYVQNLPAGADAYLGYTSGWWPTFSILEHRFPGAHLLSMAINAYEDAEGLDVENGDAVPAQVPSWVRTQQARGVWRPVTYANASTMGAVLAELAAAGIPLADVRLLVAHYTYYAHICGPDTCAYPGLPDCDGCQWTDAAAGVAGSRIDESLLAADFFAPAPAPQPKPSPVTPQEDELMYLPAVPPGTTISVQAPAGAKFISFGCGEPESAPAELVVWFSGDHAGETNPPLTVSEGGGARQVKVPSGNSDAFVQRTDAGTAPVSVQFY